MSVMMAKRKYTALVLAGNRRGEKDPLAIAGNVSHKCFIDIAGEPMLRRVVRAVLESDRVHHVLVSIDADRQAEAEALLRTLKGSVRVTVLASRESIGGSVVAAVEQIPDVLPLVITTGDNALHTAEMVRYFCDALEDCDGDGALGLTDAEILLKAYPDGQRSFHRFRDGRFSSCNLYALLNGRALAAAKAFDGGGQFAKRPWRFIFSFGLPTFLLYKSRRATLEGFLKYLSRALKVDTRPIYMPFPEGPIDVDRIADWDMANRIVAKRENTAVPVAGPRKSQAAGG